MLYPVCARLFILCCNCWLAQLSLYCSPAVNLAGCCFGGGNLGSPKERGLLLGHNACVVCGSDNKDNAVNINTIVITFFFNIAISPKEIYKNIDTIYNYIHLCKILQHNFKNKGTKFTKTNKAPRRTPCSYLIKKKRN